MKKRILYSILNEWRDEDIEDFPIDLDDVDFEVSSSGMDNEPDLGDDEFVLSTIHSQYVYFPKTKDELKKIVDMEIEKQGGVNVNLNMINTSKITDMSYIFGSRVLLETLDISKWDVSKVKTMEYMFCGCESLHELNVSKWNVSSVENMQSMFECCFLLETLDVSGWDVSRVENMYSMFNGCTSLEYLDVSGWNVSKVTSMHYMFNNCSSLETLDVKGWNVSNVVNMECMFYNCKSLHTDTREWKINTKDTGNMYHNAPNIDHN